MTITISQPCNSFGLTIRGTCPPRVGRIQTRGAAASAGLRPGDCLVKINGHCVLRSDARTAAKLIQQRSSRDDRVSFDVIRCGNQSSLQASSLENASDKDTLEGSDELKPHFQKEKKKKRRHSKEETLKRVLNETPIPTTAETVFPKRWASCTLKENLVRIGCRTLPQKRWVQVSAEKDYHPQPTVSHVHLSSGAYYKWEPDMSNILLEESSSLSDSRMDDSQSSYLEFNTARIESGLCIEQSATSVGLQLQQSISSGMSVDQREESRVRGESDILSSHKPKDIGGLLMDDNNNLNAFPSDRRSLPLGSINGNKDIIDITQSVLELEKEFVQHMTSGIQRFTRPLRRAVLSPKEHMSLFQNIEKVSTYCRTKRP